MIETPQTPLQKTDAVYKSLQKAHTASNSLILSLQVPGVPPDLLESVKSVADNMGKQWHVLKKLVDGKCNDEEYLKGPRPGTH